MKRLNLRCLVTIFCILLLVTTTIFVLKQPLHKIKSEDLIGLEKIQIISNLNTDENQVYFCSNQ